MVAQAFIRRMTVPDSTSPTHTGNSLLRSGIGILSTDSATPEPFSDESAGSPRFERSPPLQHSRSERLTGARQKLGGAVSAAISLAPKSVARAEIPHPRSSPAIYPSYAYFSLFRFQVVCGPTLLQPGHSELPSGEPSAHQREGKRCDRLFVLRFEPFNEFISRVRHLITAVDMPMLGCADLHRDAE